MASLEAEDEKERMRRERLELGAELGLEEEMEPDAPWDDLDEAGEGGSGVPSLPTDYDVTEEHFWKNRRLPVGSVIAFSQPQNALDPNAEYSAALVEARTFYKHGVHCVVKFLGSSTKAERAAVEPWAPHLLPLRRSLHRGRSPWVASDEILVVSSWRLQSRVAKSNRRATGQVWHGQSSRGACRTIGKTHRTSGCTRSWWYRSRATVGSLETSGATKGFLQSCGATLRISSGRWPGGALAGWTCWPTSKLRLAGAIDGIAGRKARAHPSRQQWRRGKGHQEEEANKGARSSTRHSRCRPAREGRERGREKEEEKGKVREEEEKEKGQGFQQRVRWARKRRRIELRQHGSSIETQEPQKSWISVQAPRDPSSGSTVSRWGAERGVHSDGWCWAEAQTPHLLPAGPQTELGPQDQGLQGAGYDQPIARLAAGGQAGGACRPPCSEDDSSGYRHQTGVVHSTPSGSLWRGRDGHSTASYPPVSPALQPPGGESRRKRILECRPQLARKRLASTCQGKRKRIRRKGKAQERKRKGQEPMERPQGERRGEAQAGLLTNHPNDMLSEFEGIMDKALEGSQRLLALNCPADVACPSPALSETILVAADQQEELSRFPGSHSGSSLHASWQQQTDEGSSLAKPSEMDKRDASPENHPQINAENTEGEQPSKACAGWKDLARPSTRREWLELLSHSSSLVDLGVYLAWGYVAGFLKFENSRAGPSRPTSNGGLFPLPVNFPDEITVDAKPSSLSIALNLSVQCWRGVCCAALNAMFGLPGQGTSRKKGRVHVAAFVEMEGRIQRFLTNVGPSNVKFEEVRNELREKRISYTGEEVSQPLPLTPEQIERGLPPRGHGASVPLLKFLQGRTKYLMENPEESLKPAGERDAAPARARVHIAPGQELAVFRLLAERRVITWIKKEDTFADHRGQITNGLFGVVKPQKFTASGKPVLRVIMNLIPTNALFDGIVGDVGLLPAATMWIPLCISAGEPVSMSQCDMASAFYLFEIPSCWHRYMTFSYEIDGQEINMVAGTKYRPACAALPMGWSSSVGVMQAVSRQVLLLQGMPANQELRKTSSLPPWFTLSLNQATKEKSWWQVYLDNFMAGQVGAERDGPDGVLQQTALAAWKAAGILTAEDKQVFREPAVTELGVLLDGATPRESTRQYLLACIY